MSIGNRQQPNPKPAGKGSKTNPLREKQPRNPNGKTPSPVFRNFIFSMMMIVGAFMLLGALVGWVGFNDGEEQSNVYMTVTVEGYLAEQFELAVKDFTSGNYPLARERLIYVLSVRPDYQPAIDLLADVSALMNITVEPTSVEPTPTITPSPTPDFRPAEDQIVTIKSLLASSQWDQALDAIANLRKLYPDHNVTEVDGMVYLALRNRGEDKILNRGDLEGGIYDFTLAESFGPLDGEAENYRTWARLYLLGNAYWGAYPEEAAYYYGQLVAAAPGLTDASGVSAFYRYWASLLQQAEMLAAEGKWCQASDKMVHVLGTWDQSYVYPTATRVYRECLALTPSVTPTFSASQTPTPSMTPTPGGVVESPTFTFTPTSDVPVNTNTPTPSFTPTFTPTPEPPVSEPEESPTYTFTPDGN